MTELAIIILNYNTKQLLKKCLLSLLKNNKSDEIWIVDNHSFDGSLDMLKKDFPKINVVTNQENFGFSKGMNIGLKKINSKIYLLLNSDTEIKGDSVNKLIDCLKNSNFSIMSSKLIYPGGDFQPNAGDLPFGVALISWLSGADDFFHKFGLSLPSFHRTDEKYYSSNREVGWVSGSVMAIKKEVIDKIGFLDEKIFMYAEDVDFCIRAKKAGLSTGICSGAEIIHIGGGSLSNPRFSQWLGEFKGLIYLYKKYFGSLIAFFLRILIYFFVFLRVIVFFIIGKKNIALNYGKIIKSL